MDSIGRLFRARVKQCVESFTRKRIDRTGLHVQELLEQPATDNGNGRQVNVDMQFATLVANELERMSPETKKKKKGEIIQVMYS